MKLNQILSETFEQLVTTAKGTSTEWMKFAMENPLTQEVKTRYPESLKKGTEFVDEQAKQLRKLLKMNGKRRGSEGTDSRSA
jgi:hypothetical protein